MSAEIVAVVEEGLGHSAHILHLGDGDAWVVDPLRIPTPGRTPDLLLRAGVDAAVYVGGPDDWCHSSGQPLEVSA